MKRLALKTIEKIYQKELQKTPSTIDRFGNVVFPDVNESVLLEIHKIIGFKPVKSYLSKSGKSLIFSL